MRYIPHTEADIRHMLEAIDVPDVDALFDSIPENLRLGRELAVPSAMAERELLQHMRMLAARNRAADGTVSFLGGGVYDHYSPVAVDHLLLRGELYTGYTPYQPEVAQGTLQIIFEFQTMISELLGLDTVNASLYDGSTAVAEAALMACRVTRRRRVLISTVLHPEYRATVQTTLRASDLEITEIPFTEAGQTDLAALEAALGDDAACAVLGYPTFFGTLDDLPAAAQLLAAKSPKTMLVAAFQEAVAFGLLEPPGTLGADIIVGEGQSLGVPASFGGPHVGLFATSRRHIRQVPGRLAGKTVDSRGQDGFVLTLSTREQHIRRDRATSNICTNQGLMATAATIHMTMLGPHGLAAVARASHLAAEHAKRVVTALPGYALRFPRSPTFNEFVVQTPAPAAELVAGLAGEGVAPGIDLGRYRDDWSHLLLITCTELTSPEDIDLLASGLARWS